MKGGEEGGESLVPPLTFHEWQGGQHVVGDRLEQLVLGCYVSVERHWCDTEPRRESTHAERIKPVLVDQFESGLDDLLHGEHTTLRHRRSL